MFVRLDFKKLVYTKHDEMISIANLVRSFASTRSKPLSKCWGLLASQSFRSIIYMIEITEPIKHLVMTMDG